MSKRNVVLKLVRRSAMSDLTCPDGEVESFSRVAWLEADSDSPDAGNPVAPEQKPIKRGVLTFDTTGVAFPPHSSLLALHSPDGDTDGGEYAIYLLPNRAIGCRRIDNNAASAHNIGILPASLGTIIGAYPCGEVVTVVGSGGVGWLLYRGAEDVYRLITALPGAPDVAFAADPAQLDGYTRIAGNYPEMDLEVNLERVAEQPSSEAIARWLDGGDSTAVDASVIQLVYAAVADRVALYCAEARDARMWLTPMRCVAAWGEALPSQPTTVDIGYQPPYARMVSWSMRGTTLALHVEFSLRPHTVAATWELNDLQKSWRGVFPKLCVYSSAEVPWMVRYAAGDTDHGIRVTGYTALSGSAGRAFRFAARSRSTVMALAREMSPLRQSLEVATADSVGGTALLGRPSAAQGEYVPDYTDFLPLIPDGAALTDEGVLLWSGLTLLSPMKENGVVYRHRDRICDNPVLAIAQGSLRKGKDTADRHPLLIFCTDGLRSATPDGFGGYHNARLISKTPLSVGAPGAVESAGHMPIPVASTSGGTVFATRHGLYTVTAAGSVRLLAAGYPQGESGKELRPEKITALLYHHPSDIILLRSADGSFVFPLQDKEWIPLYASPLTSAMSVISDAGELLTIDADNHLAELSVGIVRLDGSDQSALSDVSDLSDDSDSSDRSEGESRIPAPQGSCMIRTRPLKLGDPFVRKRIRGIRTVATGRIILEGSDDLSVWRELADASAPVKGLHTAACRFHRLTLIFDEELSDTLHSLRLDL